MDAPVPSSLDSAMLARRLGELVGHERTVQADFLLHLDEFDRRRTYLEAGFGSLWEYCLRSLHLREGAAGRRIGAMRVLRRFPRLEAPLRDGRLCLSTIALLGQVLTEGNVEDLVARAAYRTKAEVDHLVASVQPRRAPQDGIRRLATRAAGPSEVKSVPPAVEPRVLSSVASAPAAPLALAAATLPSRAVAPPTPDANEPRTAEVRPVSRDRWSLRVTIDSSCKVDLDTLKSLLSHKMPVGDLAEVLREAIRCGVEKHGKRKGASPPAWERRSTTAPRRDDRIAATIRRAVWKRDEGACTWRGEDGRRCGSRWQLEIDHIRPPLLGGSSELDNLRLLCRAHNVLHAEHVYGRDHMAGFRRRVVTISGDSERADVPDPP